MADADYSNSQTTHRHILLELRPNFLDQVEKLVSRSGVEDMSIIAYFNHVLVSTFLVLST